MHEYNWKRIQSLLYIEEIKKFILTSKSSFDLWAYSNKLIEPPNGALAEPI